MSEIQLLDPILLVAELHHEFADDVPDIVEYMIEGGKWLKPGQGIESLAPAIAERILKNPDTLRNNLRWYRWHRAEKAKVSQQLLAAAQKRKIERRKQILSSIPYEFKSLSADKSPRPRQFSFVENYWSWNAASAREEADVPTHNGLFLMGSSGTGKTGAALALYQRLALDEDPEGDHYFRRSVEFIRLTKSKHLSGESKAAFEKEFAALRDADGVVVLDDIGTEKFEGTSAEDVLYDLIDTRASWHRQTVLTCNYSPAELAAMFLDKNEPKMLRRFNQFFLRINFDKP